MALPRPRAICYDLPMKAGASALFETAAARFDAYNAADPNRETVDGREEPKEVVYARRMTAWLARLAPDAPEPLRLAARAQHIGRWEIPRTAYAEGRIGYLQWRTELKKHHAAVAGRILAEVGYEAPAIERVQALLKKERLKTDPDSQCLEDAACLVFLEHYFAEFAPQHDADKVVGILRKTWGKMSPRGRELAQTIDLPKPARALLEQALAGGGAE